MSDFGALPVPRSDRFTGSPAAAWTRTGHAANSINSGGDVRAFESRRTPSESISRSTMLNVEGARSSSADLASPSHRRLDVPRRPPAVG